MKESDEAGAKNGAAGQYYQGLFETKTPKEAGAWIKNILKEVNPDSKISDKIVERQDDTKTYFEIRETFLNPSRQKPPFTFDFPATGGKLGVPMEFKVEEENFITKFTGSKKFFYPRMNETYRRLPESKFRWLVPGENKHKVRMRTTNRVYVNDLIEKLKTQNEHFLQGEDATTKQSMIDLNNQTIALFEPLKGKMIKRKATALFDYRDNEVKMKFEKVGKFVKSEDGSSLSREQNRELTRLLAGGTDFQKIRNVKKQSVD
jgi:hypothetical protein